MSVQIIKTERLELVPIAHSDMEAIYRIAQDPRSIEDYQYVPETADQVRKWYADVIENQDPTWTIRLERETIGLIEAGVRKSGSTAEPGYFIDVNHQSKGYATEALEPVLKWIFENTEVHRVEVAITATNTGSRRVAEKCGFQLEGILRKNWPFKGEWHDSAQYSILKEEWESKK